MGPDRALYCLAGSPDSAHDYDGQRARRPGRAVPPGGCSGTRRSTCPHSRKSCSMTTKDVLAIDLGAESGRVIRVGFDGSQFQFEEIHRFPNTPVQIRGTLHWNVLRLWHEITTGIHAAGQDIAGIGVDTWGVDYALLDQDGNLLANPVHYRDSRTDGMPEWVFERVP